MECPRYFVYIATNKWNNVLYAGVTNNPIRRIKEHRKGSTKFTKKYNVCKLIYIEEHYTSLEAIHREKQIKGYSRTKKLNLIWKQNPKMNDLELVWDPSLRSG